MDSKLFKDPIYGYIQIPNDLMCQIVDSPEFQRLRRITQTSYAPVFSSAVHNRFVHSIGVYHLGNILMDHICSEPLVKKFAETDEDFKNDFADIAKFKNLFLLACLLHDIGHAPFSHTGEDFFLEAGRDFSKLHKQLQEVVGSDDLVPTEQSLFAAPHEIMSAIIGIQSFPTKFTNLVSKELFARFITGYEFPGESYKESFYNCFISFLNSKMIDVDKLDYLIRDAYITGFATVNIDYPRLLNSITIIADNRNDEDDDDEPVADKQKNQKYIVAYNKNAISVIESVIFAHDAERKWIQGHPVILYESYLLTESMKQIKEYYLQQGVSLFSSDALSWEGIDSTNSPFYESNPKHLPDRFRLLSDDDILFMMKNLQLGKYADEYFARNNRMHPVWKSEAEYNAIMEGIVGRNSPAIKKLNKALSATMKFIESNDKYGAITEELPKEIEKEIEKLNQNKELLGDETYEDNLKKKKRIQKVINVLFEEAKEHHLDTEFLFLRAYTFRSGFAKPDFNDITVLPTDNIIVEFNKAVSSISMNYSSPHDSFFYLFYKRSVDAQGRVMMLNSENLIKRLLKEFM